MKDDLTATNGTAAENEAGVTAPGKTQEKLSKPDWRSAGIGRGVWRGIIDTIIIAAGLSFLVFLNSVRDYIAFHEQQELSTSELVLKALTSLIGIFLIVCWYVGPFVLVAGAVLGSKGFFDEKKKRPPEPPTSKPEP